MAELQPYYDLLSKAAQAIELDKEYVEIDYDETDFDFTIRISGGGWDQRIDKRVAKFVLDLQKSLDALQDELSVHSTTRLQRHLVRIEVEEGSSIFNIEVGDFLKSVVGKMNGTQQVIVLCTAIFAIAGGISYSNYLAYKKRVEELSNDAETKKILAQAIEGLSDKLSIYESPPRTLVNSMGPDDLIKLPDFEEPMTKEQAKALFPRKARVSPTQYYIDDTYLVTDINIEEGFVDSVTRTSSSRPVWP